MRILVNALLLFLMPFLLRETFEQADAAPKSPRNYAAMTQVSVFDSANYLPLPPLKQPAVKKKQSIIPYGPASN